ncbi:hypothetical protein GOP47_0007155 [Adiantum capillus-veneris]|uniref:Mevalonate kinase n=1 Tax=Adiantum capillus-veneris TaxID=13818 RepID=A0A9D4V0R1_ADICA|nr:hypothetical protein GOP47_0007155 [Adiantum capillus-veneris]
MEVEARAPGKLILAGEHAVVHGYAAVAAALGLFTRCHIRRSLIPGDGVCLQLLDLKLTLQWSLQEIDSLVKLVHSDVAVANPTSPEVIARLKDLLDDKSLPEAKIGIAFGVMAFLFLYSSILGVIPSTVTVSADLPMGAGLGSSASFCVSLVAALLAMAKVSASNTHESHVYASNNGVDHLKIDEAGLDLVNKWAFKGETILHGRPSGIDNTVSTFGYIVKVKGGQLTRLQDSIPLKILLTNTKVGRNTKALVAGVGERAQRHHKAMTAIFEATEAITEEFVQILQLGSDWESAKSEQEAKVEELVEINQGLLQSMGVSHPAIQVICRTTAKYQLRSKLTGAGGGGCVLTIIPDQLAKKTLDKVKGDLEEQGFECFEAAIGVPGVHLTLG